MSRAMRWDIEVIGGVEDPDAVFEAIAGEIDVEDNDDFCLDNLQCWGESSLSAWESADEKAKEIADAVRVVAGDVYVKVIAYFVEETPTKTFTFGEDPHG